MKNITLKKLASLLLVLALVLGCVACSKSESVAEKAETKTAEETKPAETKQTATTETKTSETAPVAESNDVADEEPEEDVFVIDRSKKAYLDEEGIWRYSANDEIVNLGGKTIALCSWWASEPDTSTNRGLATEEYREEIEELYNFNFEEVKWNNFGDFDEEINNYCSTEGGGDEYQNVIFAVANNWITTPMRNHLFYDLSTLDCIDFTEDKWDVSTSDKMTLQGAVYGMRVGAAEPRGGVYFNKRLLTDAGVDPDSLYQMQADKTWTWEAFEKLCDKLTRDIDGDGIIDIYAMSSFNGDLMNSVCASNGAQIIDIDPETGLFINATNTEKFMKAYDWAHNLRKLYEAPDPTEGENWAYSYDMFKNAEVPIIVSEQYKASDFNANMSADDDFGFVVFPMGPDVDDYNGYSTDNAFVIPGFYDADTAWDIAFAYNLYTEPTPGYEDDDDWQTPYYSVFRDEKSVDETLAILRDHQTACIYPMVPNVNYNNNYWWNIDDMTAAEKSEAMWDEIQALLDAVNL